MDETPVKLPHYAKLAQVIIGIAAFFYILYVGQEILKPFIFATLIAILINPLVNYLTRHRVNRVLAILFSVLTAMILMAALLYFIGAQMMRFTDSLPEFQQKVSTLVNDLTLWISQTFSINKSRVSGWVSKIPSQSIDGSLILGKTLGTVGGLFITLFLIPVYIFMILFYKSLLLEFIARLFPKKEHSVVAEVLVESKSLIQSYLRGLLIETTLVAILNSIGLLLLGVEYAILLGIVGALLNIIPYIGGLIALAITMIVTVTTQPPVTALWVFILHLIVQFVDNNYFMPRIVASKVKINALISILAVLIGAALWGVPGMFLSIPITAILKVIFDRIEPLKPFGFLLGDNQPPLGKVIFHFKKPVPKK